MVGLLKQFWILRLNSLVVVPLLFENKEVLQVYIWLTHRFYITQNGLKMKKILGLKLEKV
jgi:hypothetical protein